MTPAEGIAAAILEVNDSTFSEKRSSVFSLRRVTIFLASCRNNGTQT
jgi:hypothetical protein